NYSIRNITTDEQRSFHKQEIFASSRQTHKRNASISR
ncbi:hypothetical protein D043_0912B, partial [Vibrio parahaemolyticus EKP-021]